jgi:hypothetical protein
MIEIKHVHHLIFLIQHFTKQFENEIVHVHVK